MAWLAPVHTEITTDSRPVAVTNRAFFDNSLSAGDKLKSLNMYAFILQTPNPWHQGPHLPTC